MLWQVGALRASRCPRGSRPSPSPPVRRRRVCVTKERVIACATWYRKAYVLRLRNSSPNRHPIHLHGLVFRPLRSNKRTLPSNRIGTIVLDKEETIDIGLVADNPGDWAFHCHAIEHQKTGLAGFVCVS